MGDADPGRAPTRDAAIRDRLETHESKARDERGVARAGHRRPGVGIRPGVALPRDETVTRTVGMSRAGIALLFGGTFGL